MNFLKGISHFFERIYVEICMAQLADMMVEAHYSDKYIEWPKYFPFNWGDLIGSGAKSQNPGSAYYATGSLRAVLDKALIDHGLKVKGFKSKGNTYQIDFEDLQQS